MMTIYRHVHNTVYAMFVLHELLTRLSTTQTHELSIFLCITFLVIMLTKIQEFYNPRLWFVIDIVQIVSALIYLMLVFAQSPHEHYNKLIVWSVCCAAPFPEFVIESIRRRYPRYYAVINYQFRRVFEGERKVFEEP